jgi:SAM-dependent methyltransferase
MTDDRAKWKARYEGSSDPAPRVPAAWVMAQCALLPAGALILDVAAGLGRHAVPLAALGHSVVALDFVESAVRRAAKGQPRVSGVVADARCLPVHDSSVDVVLCTYYLERALFPAFRQLLRPGGHLIVETYTRAHLALVAAGRAHGPSNPLVLLEPGELRRLVAPLHIVAQHEGITEEGVSARATAGIVAVKK